METKQDLKVVIFQNSKDSILLEMVCGICDEAAVCYFVLKCFKFMFYNAMKPGN